MFQIWLKIEESMFQMDMFKIVIISTIIRLYVSNIIMLCSYGVCTVANNFKKYKS